MAAPCLGRTTFDAVWSEQCGFFYLFSNERFEPSVGNECSVYSTHPGIPFILIEVTRCACVRMCGYVYCPSVSQIHG